ncbi:addiction module protein [Nostoc sp. ChiQUE01b]|uniref:addiction module protein n=1 Tax=Nostoc sp. ChiQUE01b TaxID=3075376 RepID=UPI002AD413D6|nr:addiction module protein [Nostoc sp. ChiQUE01b]MDZ8259955.1 addiction module protein [Nostoc sp. ChiQUE01b]
MSSPVLGNPTTTETSYVLLYNVSWEQLEQLDVTLAGTSARLTYLDNILEIMSPNQLEIDTLWAEEAEKRFQAVKQGEVTLIPGEQVLQELRSRSK